MNQVEKKKSFKFCKYFPILDSEKESFLPLFLYAVPTVVGRNGIINEEVRQVKIPGLPFGTNNVNRMNIRDISKDVVKKDPVRSDTAEISGALLAKNDAEGLSLNVTIEFTPRPDTVRAAQNRVSAKAYDNPDTVDEIAAKFVDTLFSSNPVTGSPEDGVRTDKIDSAQENILKNFYDMENILRNIAERIIFSQGLAKFLQEK